MKKYFFIALFLLFLGAIEACPNFTRPLETRPDSVRIITQKFAIKKHLFNQKYHQIFIPLIYFNSLVIRTPKGALNKAKLKIELDILRTDTSDAFGFACHKYISKKITADPHVSADGYDQSNLCFAGEMCYKFSVIQLGESFNSDDSLEVIFIYVPPFTGELKNEILPRASCSAPSLIMQSVWRAGLPAPKPGRSSTPTEHCIIHHSADGNGNTNYTDLVRAYYTYHTQVNGWDDIGYNYLVAANGAVYAGRDPEKAGIHQDDVLGAHFCGKNNLTMGICMIGDFMSTQPSTAALASLTQLLGWKVHKDEMDIFGSLHHPDKNGALLPVIAGHRDGCNTDCPGNLLYNLIPQIREDLRPCAVTTQAKPLIVYSDNGLVHVKNAGQGHTLYFYDLHGARVKMVQNAWAVEEVIDIAPGKFLILAEYDGDKRVVSKLFYHSSP